MKPISRKLLLAFSALGIGASAASTYVHYKLLTDVGYSSFCDVNANISCTQAYLSQYGSFLGVPVAPLGLLYFVFVLAMAGMAGRTKSVAGRENPAPAYVFAVSTLALAFVLYLAWASYFVLKIFCILCAITYVSVVAIFIVSGGATPFPMTTLPGRAPRDLKTLVSNPLALAIALLLMGGAVTVIAAFPREGRSSAPAVAQLPPVSDEIRAKLAQWWELQPVVDVPVPSNGAKVVVVKFNDYQCPACKATHELYKPVFAKYDESQVRYVIKHYPLEGECNPGANAGHYASCEAAAGMVLARAKGTAGKLEEWIWANLGPPVLTPAQMRDGVRSVGGISDFDAQYARALEEVKTDAGLGQLLKVNSTPTFFINGRKLPEIVQPQFLDVIIELELKRAQ